MKKSVIATLGLLLSLSPITAFAAPANVSSTSEFSVTVVEETIGLNIYGATNLPEEVIGRSNGGIQTVSFPNIQIENSGNTKGKLYVQMMTPSGITFNKFAFVFADGTSLFNGTNETVAVEKSADSIMINSDTDGDKDYLGPKEKTSNFNVNFTVYDKFPPGEIQLPVKWTMRAN